LQRDHRLVAEDYIVVEDTEPSPLSSPR